MWGGGEADHHVPFVHSAITLLQNKKNRFDF